MITGTTTINHAIRTKLVLSLQEYTIMDFCEKNAGEYLPDLCSQIAVKWENIAGIIAELENKGFLLNALPTEKWTDEFKKPKKSKGFTSPTLKEVEDYFKERGYLISQAKKAWEYYEVGEWKDSGGKPVKNWKQKMIAVWMKDEFKAKDQQTYQREDEGTGIHIYNR